VALQRRKKGQRLCLVIVAEGAIDKNGKDIKAEYVKDVIVQV
jgi:6-phosphofructokinase